MKRIIYLLILGLAFLLPGCEDVEVGYLEAGNAGYSIDTLLIYDVETRLEEYKGYEAELRAAGGDEILDRFVEIAAELQAIDNLLYGPGGLGGGIDDQMRSIEDAIEKGGLDSDELAKLEMELERLQKRRDEIKKQFDGLYGEKYDLNKQLRSIAQDLGFDSADDIINTVLMLENKMKFRSPWVTSPIEGILGTEPMRYSIAGVKNENPENAELFRQSLSIIGGGLMQVALDVKAPVGRYKVSILVENEGQKALLEDAFTFIVGVGDEEEGEDYGDDF